MTLFHASGNTAAVFLPIANTVSGDNINTLIILIGLEIIVAVAVILIEGPRCLSRTAPAQTVSQDSTL